MSFLNLQNHLQHFRWQKCAIWAAFKLPEGPKNGQKPYSPLPQTFFMGYYCFMPLYQEGYIEEMTEFFYCLKLILTGN